METVTVNGITYDGFVREVNGRTELCVQYMNDIGVVISDDDTAYDDYDGFILVTRGEDGQWRPLDE